MYKEKLKEFRKEKKIMQNDIAKLLNISEVAYTNYENEYYIIPLKYLIVICDNYNLSFDYIFSLTSINNEIYNKTDFPTIGARLKEFRKEVKLTQEKLAKELNTTKSVICSYEKNSNLIATPFLYTIAKKYNISSDYLLGRVDSPKYLDN